MEIHALRLFRAVVEAGGLTKAARLVQLSPGTLSKSIRRLEDELGRELFVREGRSLELGEHGRLLYSQSHQLMDEYARVREVLGGQQPRATTAALRIASFEPYTTHVLGAVVGGRLEDVDLHVIDASPGDIERLVEVGEVDLGVTYAPVPSRALRHLAVGSFELRIYTRAGAFVDTELDDLPFCVPVTTVRGGPLERLAVDSWPLEVPRRVRYRLTMLESGLELVRRGLCAIFLPEFVAHVHDATVQSKLRLVARPLPARMKPVRQTTYLVFRAGAANKSAHTSRFEDAMRAVHREACARPARVRASARRS